MPDTHEGSGNAILGVFFVISYQLYDYESTNVKIV